VADTGSDPDPLQRLSTRKVYVVIPIDVWDAQLVTAIPTRFAIAVPSSDSSRILSGMSRSPRLTRLQPNVFRLERIGTRLEVVAMYLLDHIGPGVVEDLVAALEVVEVVEGQISVCGDGPPRCDAGLTLAG
jgi:hypothetical protein